MKQFYVAAISFFAVIHPGYGSEPHHCRFDGRQYQEAKDLFGRLIALGAELREGKTYSIGELCKLDSEFHEHSIKYGFADDADVSLDPKGCSTYYGAMQALRNPKDEMSGEKIDDAGLALRVKDAWCRVPQS